MPEAPSNVEAAGRNERRRRTLRRRVRTSKGRGGSTSCATSSPATPKLRSAPHSIQIARAKRVSAIVENGRAAGPRVPSPSRWIRGFRNGLLMHPSLSTLFAVRFRPQPLTEVGTRRRGCPTLNAADGCRPQPARVGAARRAAPLILRRRPNNPALTSHSKCSRDRAFRPSAACRQVHR